MVFHRGLKLDYNDSKEMFFANPEQYEELVARIEELQYIEVKADDQRDAPDDSSSEHHRLELEDRRHERELEHEAKRIEMENEAKRMEIDHELSMAQTRIKEIQMNMEMMRLRAELGLK